MCESIESIPIAGGDGGRGVAIVPSECFVPSAMTTYFQAPNAVCCAQNGVLYVSDHGHRSVFAIDAGRTHLVTKKDSSSSSSPQEGGEMASSPQHAKQGSLLNSDSSLTGSSTAKSSTSTATTQQGTLKEVKLDLPGSPQQKVAATAQPLENSSDSASSSSHNTYTPANKLQKSSNGARRNTESSIGNPYGVVAITTSNEGGVAAHTSLLVADMHDNTIKRVNCKTGKVNTFAGTGSRGSMDGKFHFASFDKPKSLCVTPRGDVLVTEVGSHRIRLLIMDYGGIVVTVAGTGAKGYKEGSAEQALFSHPSGICCARIDDSLALLTYRPSESMQIHEMKVNMAEIEIDAKQEMLPSHQESSFMNEDPNQGNFDDMIVFVSDTMNHRVRAIHDGFTFSVAGNGEPGLADGPANLAQFDHPANICMVGHAIVVADTRNDHIRVVNLITNLVSTVSGGTQLPRPISSSIEQESTPLRVRRPNAMCLNDNGDLFVTARLETHAEIHCISGFAAPQPSQDCAPSARSQRYDSGIPKDQIDLPTDREWIRRDSVAAELADDIQEQMHLLHDVKRSSRYPAGGHIGTLVARERSRSVDAGQFAFVSESSQEMSKGTLGEKQDEGQQEQGFRFNPWNLWGRLTRLLSADSSILLHKDDSSLEANNRNRRNAEMRLNEPFDVSKRTPTPIPRRPDSETRYGDIATQKEPITQQISNEMRKSGRGKEAADVARDQREA